MNLLIVTGIFPPDAGGPATYVPEIAKSLKQHKIKVSKIITLSSVLDVTSPDEYDVIRINRKMPKLLRLIKTIFLIYRHSRNSDVVYLNGLVLEGIIACKILQNKPVAIKVVGDLIWEKANNTRLHYPDLEKFHKHFLNTKLFLLKKLQGMYSSKADRVITPSRYLKKIVTAWGVKGSKVVVIHNASKPQIIVKDIPEFAFDVVTVARLVPWKGIEGLIRICADEDLNLLIIGDGPQRFDLEKLARETGCKVKFTGQVEQKDVALLMLSAKIFVLNSTYEGLPHIVLEAHSLGMPVVASDAGGTREVMNLISLDNLFDVHDYTALRKKMRSNIQRVKGKKHKIPINSNRLEPFTMEKMVSRTANVLIQLNEK